jgi:single-stranded-DNA-specific exonuclease
MEKIWKIKPKISQKIIEKYPEYNPVFLQLLLNRDIQDKDSIKLFLEGNLESDGHSPFLFKKMDEVCNLVIKHIKAGSKIVVYGDYDADGVTATTLLKEVLCLFRANVDAYIPERATEGYGLNKNAIDFLVNNNYQLLITVDTGIRNKEEVDIAKKAGLDVIITDHHIPPEDINSYPDCLIVDAMLADETYPFKFLAGVGVSYKLAEALILKSKLSEVNKKRIVDKILDLVVIGSVADCVTVLGENRLLIKRGLKELNVTRRTGLIELINVAKIADKELKTWNIGFQLAPRINAAGRMEHANIAYNLLATKDKKEAEELAKNLNESNYERQQNTNKIFEKVDQQVAKQKEEKLLIGVCQLDEASEEQIWNEGVIGLVSNKVTEKYYRPSFVITVNGEIYKGSGRSIPEFNLVKAVEECKEYLHKFGGHKAACGFQLPKENLEIFSKKIREIAERELRDLNLQPQIVVDTELKLNEINNKLLESVQKMEPFGQDNEQPRFVSLGVKIVDIFVMGVDHQHIKLKLNQRNGGIFNAIGFGQAGKWNNLVIGQIIDIVYYIENNEFNGRSEIQLKIIDIKVAKN